MTNLSRNSSLGEDPLQAYSGLALFPRTLRSLSIHLPSHHQSDDLMQTYNILDSMPFEVEKELQEEAKAILAESLKQGIGADSSICSRSSAINSEAGGTKWENGVRRSTRIKSRPLRYL